jgi:hypothetical protein
MRTSKLLESQIEIFQGLYNFLLFIFLSVAVLLFSTPIRQVLRHMPQHLQIDLYQPPPLSLL